MIKQVDFISHAYHTDRIIPDYYNLGHIFVVLAFVPIYSDNIVLNKVIDDI